MTFLQALKDEADFKAKKPLSLVIPKDSSAVDLPSSVMAVQFLRSEIGKFHVLKIL